MKNILPNTLNDHVELAEELGKLFHNSTQNIDKKRQIIEAILTIVKSKPFWEQEIIIASQENLPEEYLLSPALCRDNLMLNITKFYAAKYEQSSELNHKYHLCHWIKYLYGCCI